MYPIRVKCIRDNADFGLIKDQVYLGIVKQSITNRTVIEIHLPHSPHQVYCSGATFSAHFELEA